MALADGSAAKAVSQVDRNKFNGETEGPTGPLVAVVVTFNRLEQLKKTLARLLEAPVEDLAAVVVVDNASDDGTQSWLGTQSDPRLDVLRRDTNGGGAGGFETGMRHAMSVHAPAWLVLMDDDARPEPGALKAFCARARDHAEGWAAAVYHPDGRICDINRPSINPFWHREVFWRTALGGGRGAFHLGPEDFAADSDRAVDGTSFVGFFISRAGVERVGYPDPRLFLYGDDVLYTLELSKAGGEIRFDPNIRFEHDFSTISASEKRFRPIWKSYYHHRNLLLVYKMAAGWLFWPALLVVVPKWLSKLRHHKGERVVFLKLILRAVRDGLRGHTDVPHRRVLRWSSDG